MRIWQGMDEVAIDLMQQASDHMKEAQNFERIVEARGDCSVIPGLAGKISITEARKSVEIQKAYARAKEKAAGMIIQAINQKVPMRRGKRTPESILCDLLKLRATEGRQQVIDLYREAQNLLETVTVPKNESLYV